MNEQAYFAAKDPKSKIEELAVAARYREQYQAAIASSKAEIEAVVKAARRNFDTKNFPRDIDNAKKHKLFNIGGGRGSHVLSYYGQQYVDALPDRAAAKRLRGPKGKGKGKKKKKAATR